MSANICPGIFQERDKAKVNVCEKEIDHCITRAFMDPGLFVEQSKPLLFTVAYSWTKKGSKISLKNLPKAEFYTEPNHDDGFHIEKYITCGYLKIVYRWKHAKCKAREDHTEPEKHTFQFRNDRFWR